jgi:CheY-like chemotaxis protein
MNNHGGRLDIRLLREDVAPNQGLAAGLSPGSYLVIEIADTGPGIPEDVRDRVFDPFFTTKPRGEGTGMGLAVAIGIAKKHGGDLRLAENSEAGTAFRLYLPVHHGSGPPAETPGAKGMPAGTEKVLVVDDEEALVDVIGEALTRLGYRVEPCRSPDEALQCLRTDPEAYDLVVTDHIMPVMTGAELGREINALRPDLPMILCSGHGEAVDRSRAEEWGFAAFMRKPVRVEDLARLVREVLDRPDA